MKIIKSILIIIALGLFSSGCTKQQPEPELPPPGSFVMEIDGMWTNSPAPGDYPGILSTSNFLFAAANIYWWNSVLTVQLAVPVAAFLESFNHEPVWDNTAKAWIWSYSVNVNNDTYLAQLHGKSSMMRSTGRCLYQKTVNTLIFSGSPAPPNLTIHLVHG